MLMPPHVYWAAGLATRSVTVAGDFRQLPPVVESESPLAGTLKRDVFEVAGIPDRLKRPEPIPYLVSLRTQYRMRPAICEIPGSSLPTIWLPRPGRESKRKPARG